MTEKVVFGQSMEGLYRALAPHTPQERAAFLKAGVTKEHFDAAYPLQAWMDLLDACGASRFAQLPELERFTEVGADGDAEDPRPPPHLERLTRAFRTANNFTIGTLESLAPNHHRVHINYTARVGFYLGVIESGCAHAGARDLVVRVLETKDCATTYEVRWA